MNRKYLDDINVTDRPDLWNQNDERTPEWEKQREEYGFDERETWSLDYSFRLWLYERLKMYLDYTEGGIDLNFHIFEYKGNTHTQKEIIDMILERLEFSFSSEYNDWEDDQFNYVGEVGELWAMVMPAMWW